MLMLFLNTPNTTPMASFSLLRPSPSPALTIKPSPISLQSPTLHFPTSLTHSFTNLSLSHQTPKPQHLLTPINAQTPNKTTPSEKSTKTPPKKPTKTHPSTTSTSSPSPSTSTPRRVKFNQLLAPKKTKFRKQHRGRMKGKACRGNIIRFGKYALQALEPAWITSRQIRAGGLAMSRHVKKYEGRGGRIWVRIFPDKSVTVKPAGTRMGSGKGSPEFWVFVVKPGRIIFEMAGVPESVAREAFGLAASKFPMRTEFVIADEGKPITDSNSLVPIVAVEEENKGGLSSEMQVMI